MASPNQLPPQVGDTTNLLLKKLVTATQGLGSSGGIFLTEAEADQLYFRLNGSNGGLTAGRVLFAGAGGILDDDAGFTFNSGTGALTATSFNGNVVGGTVSGTTAAFTGGAATSGVFTTNDGTANIRLASTSGALRQYGYFDATAGSLLFARDAGNTAYIPLTVDSLTFRILSSNSLVGLFSSTGLAVTGTLTPSGQILAADGAIGTPAYSFSGSTTMGFSRSGAGLRANIPTAGDYRFYVNSVLVGSIFSGGGLHFSTSSAANNPAITDLTNGDSGLFFPSSGVLGITANNTEVGRFTSTGLAVTGAVTATAGMTSVYSGGDVGLRVRDSTDTSDTYFVAFQKANSTIIGSIRRVTTTDAVAYNTSSDFRLKTNIRTFTNSGTIIDSIRPVLHDWKSGAKDTYGFIAQEVYAAFPQAVTKGDDGEEIENVWQMDRSALIPVLWAEVKNLRARLLAAGIA